MANILTILRGYIYATLQIGMTFQSYSISYSTAFLVQLEYCYNYKLTGIDLLKNKNSLGNKWLEYWNS